MLLLFNKPFDVLCQFTDGKNRQTLADFVDVKGVYPAGRLDKDSEGLVLLTDDGSLQHQISHPSHKMSKTYWVQVEGKPKNSAISQLSKGIQLKDGKTAPARVVIIPEPDLWLRKPPIRVRANIPTTWLKLTIQEGRNRQVRRMTAAIGHPTLRLVRSSIGPWSLENLAQGQWLEAQIPDNWRTMTSHLSETPENHTRSKHKSARYRNKQGK